MIRDLLFVSMILMSLTSKAQTQAGDVTFKNSITLGKEVLVLNGAGIREKYFMDLYAAGLYLQAKGKDGTAISKADDPMLLRIEIISSLITTEKMEEAIKEGFIKSSGASLKAFQPKIDQFRSAFKDPIKPGDVFEIIYSPADKSTSVTKAGKEKVRIPGLDFKEAVFGIWLGKSPADEDLKTGLLGL